MNKTEHYLYVTWKQMRKRCNNPNYKEYHNYGGRGIKVSPEWDDFWVFVEDLGDRPEGHTLERKDNNKGYSKENCVWATHKEQNNNTRKVKKAKGYAFHKATGKYKAHICINGKLVHLGLFDTPEEARHRYLIALHNKMNKSPVL